MREEELSDALVADAALDLVDPEDGRSHRVHGLQGAGEDVLGRAGDARVDQVHVHAEQGQVPEGGDDLGGQALAAAGDAHGQDALGLVQAEFPCFLGKGFLPLQQPVLQLVQSAHVFHGQGVGEILQDVLLEDQLLFLHGGSFRSGRCGCAAAPGRLSCMPW